MKYLKLFTHLNESLNHNEYYNLYGNTVYVTDMNKFGNDERRVEYVTKEGEIVAYIGTEKDIEEDFKITDDIFEVKYKTPKKKKTKRKVDNKTYDLVFYMGKRKMETIESNINLILAKGLKKQYSSFPNYKTGELKVILNK